MEAVQPLAAILLVLGLLSGSLVLLRKRRMASFFLKRLSPAAERKIELLERVALGANHALHLVRIGERSYVIATAPGACRLICDADRTSGVKE
jgi:flagellar biogenesis protein FliO